MPRPPTIVAHRGTHHTHPENSLSAITAAWTGGFDWVEFDVRLTADLIPVLMHDDSLERTTTGRGLVVECTSTALPSMRLRDTDTGLASTDPVPRLTDILARTPSSGRLLVEIKPSDYGATVRHTLALLDPATCVVQSFDEENLRRAQAMNPSFELAWLIETVHDPLEVLDRPWPAVHCHHPLLTDASVVERIHAAGKSVGVWTVNQETDLRRCIAIGVDMIITDEPALARKIVHEFHE